MEHNTDQPCYTVDLIWTMSYPSKSWAVRRFVLAGILWIAGATTMILAEYTTAGQVGWVVTIGASGYGIYLAQKGYINAKKAKVTETSL